MTLATGGLWSAVGRGLQRPHGTVAVAGCVLVLATCAPLPGSLGEADRLQNSVAPPLPDLPDAQPVDGTGLAVGDVPEGRPIASGNSGAGDMELDAVETQQPRIRLLGDEASTDDKVGAALGVEGVRFATSLRLGEIPIAGPDGATTIKAAQIDPKGFRVLAPQVTADSDDVWHRLTEGDVALTHDTGQQLEVELGERVPAGEDSATIRVGAFASNGIPPVADAIMVGSTAEKLGFKGREAMLVAVHDDADIDRVARELEEAIGLQAEEIELPEMQQASHSDTSQQGGPAPSAIEPFNYQSIGDGMIRIDPGWVRQHIVSAQVPVFRGTVTCHRAMIPQLRAALQQIVDEGLDHLIRPNDYGGCWVPRHIMFNPRRGLSMHAWGLAIDFNVSDNQYGARPSMDPRIVEIFQQWGFSWGGHWSTPDGMHFELNTLMDVGQ